MWSIPQSTSFVHVFKAYLSSDHVSEATGKTIAITISKNGGAFGNPNAGATNATEISSGWYKVTLDTTDTGTKGLLAIRGTAATIDDVGDRLFVVNATNGGLTALPDTACTTNASLLTSGTGTAQLSVSGGHVSNVDTLTTYTGNTVQTGDAYARLGAPAGASTAADIAGVKSDTGTILTDVNTGAGAIYTRLGAPAGASIAADIAADKAVNDAIKLKTDNLPAAPASTTNIAAGTITTVTNLTNAPSAGDFTAAMKSSLNAATPSVTVSDKTGFAPSVSDVADAVWDEASADHTTAGTMGGSMAGILSDMAVLDSDLASNTAVLQTDISGVKSDTTAIKSKTDNLPASPAATGDIPTANQNADALLDRSAGIETNRTVRQGMRLILAALLGKASGLAGTTATYRDTNDTTDRIVATVDADGNRSAVTLDAS